MNLIEFSIFGILLLLAISCGFLLFLLLEDDE